MFLLFPADWSRAALVLALASVLMVVGLFSYLNLSTQRVYFRLWTAAWLFYAVYLAASLGLEESPHTPWLVMARRACMGISALFMFWGGFELVNLRRTRLELGGCIVLILVWSYFAAYRVQDEFWITLPVCVLLCMGGLYTGVNYMRLRRRYHGATVLGCGYVLWGMHLLAFPFLGDSQLYWANASAYGSVFALMITVGMLVEQSVHVSERYYRDLFNSAGDAIFLLDSKSMRILEANRTAEQMLGAERHSLNGRRFIELAPDLKSNLSGVITEDSIVEALNRPCSEFAITCADGRQITCEGRAAQAGCFRGPVVQVNVRDITARKRQEQELRDTASRLEKAMLDLQRTEQQVIQHERLNALTKMASGVAHDFNNALAKIIGFNELLLSVPENLRNPEKVKKYLHMNSEAAQDAVRVVNRLREFYRHRQDTDVYEPVDLRQVVEQAIILTQPKWKDQMLAHGATVWFDVDLQEGLFVRGNATELREVMINLIFNSVESMTRGGMLNIRSHVENEVVTVVIKDTGCGMSDAVKHHCLEPFYTTKDDGHTGLGLAIVYGIITRHGGTIKIGSQESEGTTVSISLPAQPDPVLESVHVPDSDLKPCRILLAEDEPLIRDIQAEYLRTAGHHVTVAPNGVEAIAKFEKDRFDLVITDRAMPEMNGDQLIAAIRAMSPETLIILVTGFGDMLRDDPDDPNQPDVILGKPVTPQKLCQTVHGLMAHRETVEPAVSDEVEAAVASPQLAETY